MEVKAKLEWLYRLPPQSVYEVYFAGVSREQVCLEELARDYLGFVQVIESVDFNEVGD